VNRALSFVTDETFDGEISKTSVSAVVLDFTADWCEPCKAMEPILEQIAGEYAAQVRVLRVDFDECPDVADRYQVMSLPTLILLKDGEPVQRIRGPQNRRAIITILDELLA
jgi:thioredoxin 1